MQQLSAVLATLAFAGGIIVLIGRWIAPSSGIGKLARQLVDRRIELSAAIGVASIVGSLYFSEIAGMVPCRFCWFQRTMMYPIGVIGVVALVARERQNRWYFVALAAIGLPISIWHNLIETFPTIIADTCSTEDSCALIWFRTWGIFTLATMAMCGFFAVLVFNLVRFDKVSVDD